MHAKTFPQLDAVVLSPAVIDSRVHLTREANLGHKHESTIKDQLGGGGPNVARQMSKLGFPVKPILMTGQDSLHSVAENLVQQEFKSGICPQLMYSTRRSVLIRDSVYTQRSAVAHKELPRKIVNEIEKAGLLIVGPLAAEDYPIAVQALKVGSESMLQLSNQQLKNPYKAIELARLADMTVINDDELELWTGCNEIDAGICWLRDRGVSAIMVTSRTSVTGFVEGQWIHAPAYKTGNVVTTVGAGDVFTGTLAAMRMLGESWKKALPLALAAAALHVEGKTISGMSDLQEVSRHRKTVPYQADSTLQLINLPRVATVGISVLLGLLTLGLFS